MKRFAVILVLACCHAVALFSQGMADSVASRLREQLRLFPQEKVSLHADRAVLMPGDTIRLKAYVTDAATLRPLLDDQFVYVELLNAQNRSLQRKRLIASNNLFTGYIYLPPDQQPGVYHLWAYTLYSAQVEGYDCLLPIQVGSDAPTVKEASTAANPVLRFFPEGGSVVEGAPCMVAFEATTEAGDSMEVEGDVVDDEGRVVSRFKTYHRGLGFFPLTAEQGRRYSAVFRDRRGRNHSFRLPQARADVASLRCRVKSDEVQVGINCGTALVPSALNLLVCCRGQLVSLQPVRAGATYHLPLRLLPAGVNSLLLLDGDGRVLSERLVFSNNGAQRLPLTLEASAREYGLRDSIALSLSLPGLRADEMAFLSLSATDDGITRGRCWPSLWSQLLLGSDLQGLHGGLDDYFMPAYQADKLDLLMMVCGWRRYDMGAVLRGDYATPTVQKEREQSVTGRVTSVFGNKPVDEAQVVLAITKQSHVDVTTTDSAGRFEFHGLNYPEDVDAFVYALRQKKRRCLVETDRERTPYAPDVKLTRRSARLLPWMDIDDGLLEMYARDSHLLQEVVVKGHNRYGGTLFTDNTTLSLDRRQIEEGEYPDFGFLLLCTNMLEVDRSNGTIKADDMWCSGLDRFLSRSGVSVPGGMKPNRQVKLYVNGMHIPGLTFEDLDIDDLDRVDVYLGHKAWVFGSDVGGGVVNVTTRNGLNRSTGSMFNNRVLRLVGYQKPVEYYFPRYPHGEKPSQMQPDVRRTLYWNPYLRMGNGAPMQLSFYSADVPTSYTISVEGITTEGRIVGGKVQVMVKE